MRYLLIVLFLSGCSEHWGQPSSKLASQADNYLENDKISFFSGYCHRLGDALNCFKKKYLIDCKEQIEKTDGYTDDSAIIRFFSPDNFQRLRIKSIENQRKFEDFKDKVKDFEREKERLFDDYVEEEISKKEHLRELRRLREDFENNFLDPITDLIANFFYDVVDTITKEEWPKCREIAGVG